MNTSRLAKGRNLKISLYKLGTIIMAVLTVLCSACMWRALDNWPIPSSVIRISFLVITFFLALYKTKLTKNDLIYLLAIMFFLIIYIVMTRVDIAGYMLTVFSSFTVLILLIMSGIKSKKFNEILEAFENVVLVIAVISIICWLLGSVANILPGRSTITFTFSGRSIRGYTYGYLYFENPRQYQNLFGRIITRNTGVFVEAPTYSSVLIYAILIEYFSKRRKAVISLLVTASLTTFSAKSYIFILEFFILTYLFKDKKTNTNRTGNNLGRLIGIIALTIIVSIGFYYVLEVKSDTLAYTYRLDSAMAGIRTWMQHPLFGSGYGNSEEIISNADLFRRATNVSMGLTTLLGQGGFYLTAFYLFPFIACRKKVKNTWLEKVYLFVLAIGITDLIISRVMYAVYFEMIVAMGYVLWHMKRTDLDLIKE